MNFFNAPWTRSRSVGKYGNDETVPGAGKPVRGTVRVRAPGARRLQRELAAVGIRSTLLDGNELMVEGAASARVGEIAFRAGMPLHELVPESSSLEDVFLELTAEEPS